MNSKGLIVENLRKSYGPTVALDNVSLTVYPGEVHTILGENGAGKSTLIKIISGVTKPDSGSITVDGQIVSRHRLSPKLMIRKGVATVYQEGGLVPDLSVAQNLCLTRSLSPFTSMGQRNYIAQKILEDHKITNIDPSLPVRKLTLEQRQKIEIIRAVSSNPTALLFDEAFSSLSPPAFSWFINLLEEMKANNVSIVIISHRLEEVKSVSDRITVLRNGRVMGTYPAREVTDEVVVKLMLGYELSALAAKTGEDTLGQPLLKVNGLLAPPKLRPTSFIIREGEIVGVAGLEGQGVAELFKSLYGSQPNSHGTIEIGGKLTRVNSPRMAIQNGIVYIPNDRAQEGLCINLTVAHNMSLPILSSLTRHGWLQASAERKIVSNMLRRLSVSPDDPYIATRSLSGGNQQKVLLGKWLLANTRIFLLYDPTRGVDVGAKREINLLIRELAAKGRAVLFYSTDIQELVNIAHRVLVFYRGTIVEELKGQEITSQKIVAAMTGLKKGE